MLSQPTPDHHSTNDGVDAPGSALITKVVLCGTAIQLYLVSSFRGNSSCSQELTEMTVRQG
ncbi:hypothetical protein L228DRAFT_244740 [Xylona heveae TC161]|uniref:Uncharacterized protein n=1 Tax=Xylona heveae (strain CBS 132557 / TC161) TaxID=1328760 RepID=A0A165J6U4_XYLHT|nr:hypothetical protein L228DRAFT_244740 [Xylona heveae TC161]KZF25815.1 hypothetical protein L228DRAFT_244740 [Xylona heveae TC161]